MKNWFTLILAGLLALFLASCASRERSPAYSSGWNYNSQNRGGFSNKMLDYNQQKAEEDRRMIIYNASLSLEGKNADTIGARVVGVAKRLKGFVVSAGNNSTTIRVPADSLKLAITMIETLGKVKSKNISGNDVTDEFTDYNTRLENAEKSRKRYLELLAKAVTVDEILKVEKELERLNTDIDLLKGKMNRIDHLVNYSTVTVYHTEKTKPGIIGYVFVGLYKGVKWLFVRN
jgi:hypothetical protein